MFAWKPFVPNNKLLQLVEDIDSVKWIRITKVLSRRSRVQRKMSSESNSAENVDIDDNLLRKCMWDIRSRPPCRRLNAWPDPKLEGPFEISRAALKAKPTARVTNLAQPKRESYDYEALYNTPLPDKMWYKKSAVLSPRQIELAKPRQYIESDEEIERTYFTTKQQWDAHMKRIERLATPRRIPPSPTDTMIRAKTPLSKILPRLERLAKPVYYPPNLNEKTDEEMRTIKVSVLKYTPTERILKLATPKKLHGDAEQDLNWADDHRKRSLNARRYVASERIIKLAMPIERGPGLFVETKPNPYKVNPRSLKYRASARIKKLALPRIRN